MILRIITVQFMISQNLPGAAAVPEKSENEDPWGFFPNKPLVAFRISPKSMSPPTQKTHPVNQSMPFLP